MKACTVLVLACFWIMSSAQHNVTTEESNVVTQTQKTMLDGESVGDDCIRNEQCIKTMGKNAECKSGTCTCKTGSLKRGEGLNCEAEKSFAVHNMARVTCFALIAMVNTAMQ